MRILFKWVLDCWRAHAVEIAFGRMHYLLEFSCLHVAGAREFQAVAGINAVYVDGIEIGIALENDALMG